MALWQLRIGERGQKVPDWREVFLAQEHSLILIDYGIKEDISKMDTEAIEKHIKKVQEQYKKSHRVIKGYIRHVLNFKNGINKGDYIISPFNYLEGGGNFRIGRVTGEFGTLESLFKGDLSTCLAQHAYSTYLERNLHMDECRNLPTRKVKWISGLINAADIHEEIILQSDEGDGKGAVAKLRFSRKIPYELTSAKISLSTLDVTQNKLVELSEASPDWLGKVILASGGITTISLAITTSHEAMQIISKGLDLLSPFVYKIIDIIKIFLSLFTLKT